MRAATRAVVCAAFAAAVPALVDGSASVERPLGTPAPVVWDPLPYGSVAPHGWLLEQLLTQANGLAGFMPTSTFPGALAVNTSRWVGGDGHSVAHASWFPYWLNGNVPLLMLLRAAGPSATSRLDPAAQLEAWVDTAVEYVLAHTHTTRSDPAFGWIGPYDGEPGDDNGYGLWEPLNTLRALLYYAEATPRVARPVAAAVVAHLTAEAKLLATDPIIKWASTRWPTFVQVCLYAVTALVPRWGDDAGVMPLGADGTRDMLLNASRLFEVKGMDWEGYYKRTGGVKFPLGSVDGWNTNDHGVNNAEGALAWPAMHYRLWGDVDDAKDKMALVLRMLDTYQGQPNALFCADEVFCGRAPHRGTETCAVVEAMASLEQGFGVLGEPALMDRVEALAFNALPAATTSDMWTHVYVQQANSVFAGQTNPSRATSTPTPAPRRTCASARARTPRVGSRRAAVEAADESAGGCGVRDTPSGEDEAQNYYGVSHFPCCITNFGQGWPKFAASAIMTNAAARAFVVASLLPVRATLMPAAMGADVEVVTRYPFGDDAQVVVDVAAGVDAVDAFVRIPGWAVGATVDDAPAANGTLVRVACAPGTRTTIAVRLRAPVVVERGWGVHATPAGSAVVYADGGAAAPSTDIADWALSGGASIVGSREPAPALDVRTGDPGGVGDLDLHHPIYGGGHYLDGVHVSFRYVAGYTPRGGASARAPTVTLRVLDARSRAEVATLWTSPPLGNYSFDDYTGYSAPVDVDVVGARLPNSRPLLLSLRVDNAQRNLQLLLPSIAVRLRWTANVGPEPPTPVSNVSAPAADAAVVRRGPLLYALHPTESVAVTKRYDGDAPARPLAVDYQISTTDTWAHALLIPRGGAAPSLVFDPSPSAGWAESAPFDTAEYPFSISAPAVPLPSWGYWHGSKITDQPPPSPVNCSAADVRCAERTTLRLVPFGSTNIRIAVWPWAWDD